MAKKITITLSDAAEKHFNNVMYSLDLPKGNTTQSDVINHCLEELAAFEDITEDQVTNYLLENHAIDYKAWVENNITKH